MAHSYVQAHDSEYDAFRSFVKTMDGATLLVDTYDTIGGVHQVIRLARELDSPTRIAAIRLDSGDLGSLAGESRRLLDQAGLKHVRIFASNSLDEYVIEGLIASGAPIDGFGVGTRMGVSADAPYLDTAYKLVEYAGKPRLKRSTGKVTLPGSKQVFRQIENGVVTGDVLACRDESLSGMPLLWPVMVAGKRVEPRLPLRSIQKYCREQIASLPPALRQLNPAGVPYSVKVSPKLDALARSVL